MLNNGLLLSWAQITFATISIIAAIITGIRWLINAQFSSLVRGLDQRYVLKDVHNEVERRQDEMHRENQLSISKLEYKIDMVLKFCPLTKMEELKEVH